LPDAQRSCLRSEVDALLRNIMNVDVMR